MIHSTLKLMLILIIGKVTNGSIFNQTLANFFLDFADLHSIAYMSFVAPKSGYFDVAKSIIRNRHYHGDVYIETRNRTTAKTLNVVIGEETFNNKWRSKFSLNFRHNIWLIQLNSSSDISSLIENLPLDLDDDFYLFLLEDSQVLIWEAYKMRENLAPIHLMYGTWHFDTGFDMEMELGEKWERRQDLSGIHFWISGASSVPYSIVEEVEGEFSLSGMYPNIFHSLQEILNFTYTVKMPADRQWGSKNEDGTWTGVLGLFQRNEIDFSPVSFTRTKLRSEIVDFALPITHFHHRFFIQTPRESLNWLAYLEPLTARVWLSILALCFIFPPILYLLTHLSEPIVQYEREINKFSLIKSLLFVTGALTLAKAWQVTPATARARILFLAIMIGGSLIFWHWEAMIISYLAVRIPALPFRNLEELLRLTNKKIVVKPGSSYVDDFRYAQDTLRQEAWNTRIRDYLSNYPNTREELIDFVASDSDFVLYDNFYSARTFDAYRKCQIIDVPQQYDERVFAYVFKKDSPFLPLFNFHLKRMLERGSMSQVVTKYLANPPQHCQELSGAPLGFESCFTAFLIILLGSAISLGLMAFEKARSVSSKSVSLSPLLKKRNNPHFYPQLSNYELREILLEREKYCTCRQRKKRQKQIFY